MASYFIKGRIYYNRTSDIGYTKTMIIDFNEFEKVNSTSIYEKVNKIVNGCKYDIEDIIKL